MFFRPRTDADYDTLYHAARSLGMSPSRFARTLAEAAVRMIVEDDPAVRLARQRLADARARQAERQAERDAEMRAEGWIPDPDHRGGWIKPTVDSPTLH